MSKSIKLENLKEIKKWIELNTPKEPTLAIQSAAEFINKPIKKLGKTGIYYGVEHILYSDDGSPMVALGRVYRARDAEGALGQYVFGPSRHTSGRGEECVDVTLYDDFKRALQEIRVFPLLKGTGRFV